MDASEAKKKRKHRRKPEDRAKRECRARVAYVDLLPEYGERLRLICPHVQKDLAPLWRFSLPMMPKEVKPPIASRAWRIFVKICVFP